jgi:hypothetical protein
MNTRGLYMTHTEATGNYGLPSDDAETKKSWFRRPSAVLGGLAAALVVTALAVGGDNHKAEKSRVGQKPETYLEYARRIQSELNNPATGRVARDVTVDTAELISINPEMRSADTTLMLDNTHSALISVDAQGVARLMIAKVDRGNYGEVVGASNSGLIRETSVAVRGEAGNKLSVVDLGPPTPAFSSHTSISN